MFIILLLILLIASLVALIVGSQKYNDLAELIGCFGSAVFGLTLFIMLITWLGNYSDTQSLVAETNAAKITIAEARKTSSETERMGLETKILDINTRIAREKFWNKSIWFGYQVYDGVDSLELLK